MSLFSPLSLSPRLTWSGTAFALYALKSSTTATVRLGLRNEMISRGFLAFLGAALLPGSPYPPWSTTSSSSSSSSASFSASGSCVGASPDSRLTPVRSLGRG